MWKYLLIFNNYCAFVCDFRMTTSLGENWSRRFAASGGRRSFWGRWGLHPLNKQYELFRNVSRYILHTFIFFRWSRTTKFNHYARLLQLLLLLSIFSSVSVKFRNDRNGDQSNWIIEFAKYQNGQRLFVLVPTIRLWPSCYRTRNLTKSRFHGNPWSFRRNSWNLLISMQVLGTK